MDKNTECSKHKCENDASWSPIRLKKQKLIESESPERIELIKKDCSVENTSNTSSDDDLKDKIINGAIEPNDGRGKDQNTPEATNDTDASKSKSSATILSLSNDILLQLSSYLTRNDVYNLSRCHPRLFTVWGHKSRWIKVNTDCDGSYPSHDEEALFFHPGTKYLRIVKTKKDDSDLEDMCFREDFFEHLADYAPNLQSLIIENHVLHSSSFLLKYLPNTLTELRLPNVKLAHFVYDTGYFHQIDTMLPNLEIVDFSYCQWFDPHALMALGKCNNLKELRVTGCRNMKNFIPYASIATSCGFKNLQTVDLRLTGIVDREIACFNKTKSLKHIYLEKPPDVQNCVNEESVTDMCVSSFTSSKDQPEPTSDMVLITRIPKDGGSSENNTLETLVIRNYPGITNSTLRHAQNCLKSLTYLDVTGCSCTMDEASVFKVYRPEVTLIYDGVPL